MVILSQQFFAFIVDFDVSSSELEGRRELSHVRRVLVAFIPYNVRVYPGALCPLNACPLQCVRLREGC